VRTIKDNVKKDRREKKGSSRREHPGPQENFEGPPILKKTKGRTLRQHRLHVKRAREGSLGYSRGKGRGGRFQPTFIFQSELEGVKCLGGMVEQEKS